MRGNKPTAKAKIVKERFVEAMKAKGVTIKALGDMSLVSSATDRDRSEKTIGRYINKGEMPFDLLDHLAQVLDVEPAFLMGKYDIKPFNNPETDEDRRIRERLQAFITPQRFPYALDQMKKVKVDQYYNALLSIHGISLEQFIRLEPEKRFRLMHLIESKLVPTLMDFFPVDAQGENGDPNYYELDSQIDNNEEEYFRFGLDYWKEPDYHEKIRKLEAEQLENW